MVEDSGLFRLFACESATGISLILLLSCPCVQRLVSRNWHGMLVCVRAVSEHLVSCLKSSSAVPRLALKATLSTVQGKALLQHMRDDSSCSLGCLLLVLLMVLATSTANCLVHETSSILFKQACRTPPSSSCPLIWPPAFALPNPFSFLHVAPVYVPPDPLLQNLQPMTCSPDKPQMGQSRSQSAPHLWVNRSHQHMTMHTAQQVLQRLLLQVRLQQQPASLWANPRQDNQNKRQHPRALEPSSPRRQRLMQP